MKKVWVNRFNADGSIKTMNEWVQREIKSKYTTHFATYPGGRIQEHDANFADNKQENLIVEICGKFDVCLEYIGNQRGDGWFNVEDEQPPTDVPVLVLRDPQYVKELTHDDVAIGTYWSYNEPSFGHTFELSEGGCWFLERCDTLLWQPIEPPKHLD